MEPLAPTPPSTLLTEHHHELDATCCDLRSAIECADPLELVARYRRFEEAMLAHLDAEEQLLLPAYAATFPATARELREEHAELRRLLAHVELDVDRHAARAEQLDRLVERLRSHTGFEETTLYRWADQHLDGRAIAEVAAGLPRHGLAPAAHHVGGRHLEHTGFSR